MTNVIEKIRSKGVIGTLAALRRRVFEPVPTRGYVNPDPGAADRFAPTSDLGRIYDGKVGNPVNKWHHYIEIYESHLARFRGTDFRMLEIGVQRGGSIEMWREYFGPAATIYGIDIDPKCKRFDGIAGQIRIGSQDDPGFLKAVIAEMGGVDVIIDDGSHDSQHIKSSFDVLFPLLSDGGVYVVEDLHCAYWPHYSGGYRWRWSFINEAKRMIDDMHHWYHTKGQRNEAARGHLKAMHVYDSVIVFDKAAVPPPVNSIRPKKSAGSA